MRSQPRKIDDPTPLTNSSPSHGPLGDGSGNKRPTMALLPPQATLLVLVLLMAAGSRSARHDKGGRARGQALGRGSPAATTWRLPPIDWAAGGVVGVTDHFAVRAFDMVRWPGDGRWYMYCDLVLYANPVCPTSYGSEIGCFSAASLGGPWTYHGIVLRKNASAADAGGLATPTAIVRGGKVFVYFAYEGLGPGVGLGGGLRGIGGASAAHPRGPFGRMPPVAEAPTGWRRPAGPGGILDDPEVIHHAGRFHLSDSRKLLDDRNCSLAPSDPAADAPAHCTEWHTSVVDGIAWTRRGILTPPPSGKAMGQTKSARVYGGQLVIIADGGGQQRGFAANASGLVRRRCGPRGRRYRRG